MSALHYQHNELYLEQVPLRTIADTFGTPCYVYSQNALQQNIADFKNAFQQTPHQICYAVKANHNIELLRLLVQSGCGFDIVSLGELSNVLAAGANPAHIIFSGVGKKSEEIERAIQANVYCLNVESEAELHRIQMIAAQQQKIVNIALRINPNIEANTHAHIATGLYENKFGIDCTLALSLAQWIQSQSHLRLIGLACHIGSQITALNPFLLALETLIHLQKQLATQQISITHLNIGGGLGIRYHQENPPTIAAYVDALLRKLAEHHLEHLTLIVEPGRSLIGNTGVLLTRVEYLKQTAHKRFAIVDAAMNDLLRPALYNAWQPILPLTQRQQTPACYDIVGPICESADFLGKDRHLAIETNDLLAIDLVGAYGFSMSSHYNARPRPAEVLVAGDHIRLIRPREQLTHY